MTDIVERVARAIMLKAESMDGADHRCTPIGWYEADGSFCALGTEIERWQELAGELARAAIAAHEQALAAAGLVVRPREPTTEMCMTHEAKPWEEWTAYDLYCAMTNAYAATHDMTPNKETTNA